MPSKRYRKNFKRTTKRRILIICEGQVTEPSYFKHIKNELRIQFADIKIVHGKGSDPLSIFNTANKLQKREKDKGRMYDKIFCVFDRDEHDEARFKEACQKIKSANFKKILSIPCIEYWFLLHFEPSPTGGLTASNYQKRLQSKKYLTDYKKEVSKDNFDILWKKYKIAKANAVKAREHAKSVDNWNPFTKIYLLVDYLKTL